MIIKNRDSFLKYFTAIYSCFFYAHYSLLSANFSPTNLPFIFFGTIFCYNLLQTNKVNWYLLILSGLSSVILPTDIIIQYFVIVLITLIYPKYLRPNYILKPVAIALSWCLLFKSSDLTLYLESFFFIIALSLPFDLRDKLEDTDITTLADLFDTKNFKYFCLILWGIYGLFKAINNIENNIGISWILLSSYYLINLNAINVNSSKLKTYVLLDLTIALQFFLTYLK